MVGWHLDWLVLDWLTSWLDYGSLTSLLIGFWLIDDWYMDGPWLIDILTGPWLIDILIDWSLPDWHLGWLAIGWLASSLIGQWLTSWLICLWLTSWLIGSWRTGIFIDWSVTDWHLKRFVHEWHSGWLIGPGPADILIDWSLTDWHLGVVRNWLTSWWVGWDARSHFSFCLCYSSASEVPLWQGVVPPVWTVDLFAGAPAWDDHLHVTPQSCSAASGKIAGSGVYWNICLRWSHEPSSLRWSHEMMNVVVWGGHMNLVVHHKVKLLDLVSVGIVTVVIWT